MNMEGISNTSVISSNEMLYSTENTSSVLKKEVLTEEIEDKKIRKKREHTILHGENYEKWAECMKQFVKKQNSADEFRDCIKDTLVTVYDEALAMGNWSKEGLMELFNMQYFEMKRSSTAIARGANLLEGWEMARSYGISERQCFYYNAEYYYLNEEMREMIQGCFDEFAEEKGIGDLKNEEYYEKNKMPGFDFNNSWNCQYKNLKMINTEADPPRNFVFFYGANMETSKEVLYVNGEGISSDQGQTLELSADLEEDKPYLTFLDFAKSRCQAQEELWERLHYLKNFRIYSLKRLLLNY